MVFSNTLWLLGGTATADDSKLGEAWYSTDGVTWVQVSASAAFDTRANPKLNVFNGKLYLISGDVKSDPVTFGAKVCSGITALT